MVRKYIKNTYLVLSFAFPLILTGMVRMLCGNVNAIMLSRIGREYVASYGLISTILNTIQLSSYAFLFSSIVYIGKSYRNKEYIEIGNVFRNSMLLCIIIAILTSILIWNSKYILLFFGQDISLVSTCDPYLKIVAIGTIISAMYMFICDFAIGILKTKLVFLWSVTASVTILILNYVFLFRTNIGRIYPMHIVALSNILTYSVILLIVVLYLRTSKEYIKFKMFPIFSGFSMKYIKKILCIGWPIFIYYLFMTMFHSSSEYMSGWLGMDSIVSYSIVYQYLSLTMITAYGISHIASVLGIEKYMYCISASIMVSLIFSIIYIFIPEKMISVYLGIKSVSNFHAYTLCSNVLRVTGVMQLAETVCIVSTGILRSKCDTKFPMYINVLSNWIIGIPIGYLLAFRYGFGTVGICIGSVIGSVIICAVLTYRIFYYRSFRL